MALSLPSTADLLRPPHMALLRRSEPVLVPPGEQWTTVSWERADSDAWDGFDRAQPTGWRVPVGGFYFANTGPLHVASQETFTLSAAVLLDGEVAPYATVAHLCRGDASCDDLEPERRPLVAHVLPFGAHLRPEAGQACGLALRHSLPGPLLVGSDGNGLGWAVQRL